MADDVRFGRLIGDKRGGDPANDAFVVPRWLEETPVASKPCSSCGPNDDEKPGACWRVYVSNEDIDGVDPGFKSVRCPSWTPTAVDFAAGAT